MQLYIALGANLGNREEALRQALRRLAETAGPLLRCSSFYETEPLGFSSPHQFLNAVALFETALPAEQLLTLTQRIEREMGRTQKSADGIHTDRPIDIDLLALDGQCLNRPGLVLPHPRLHERRFVLEPLTEIAPGWTHPLLGESAATLLERLNRPHIEEAHRPDAATAAALNALLPQLSQTARPLGPEEWQALCHRPGTHLYLLRDETGAVRGMATLCLCASPTGTKAWVEDVVVDSRARGRRYGRALVEHAKAEGQRLGAKAVMLTSRPARVAANRLYASAGFLRRETNVYRWQPAQGNPLPASAPSAKES